MLFKLLFFPKHKELSSCVFIILYDQENEKKSCFTERLSLTPSFVCGGFEGFLERTTVCYLALRYRDKSRQAAEFTLRNMAEGMGRNFSLVLHPVFVFF